MLVERLKRPYSESPFKTHDAVIVVLCSVQMHGLVLYPTRSMALENTAKIYV